MKERTFMEITSVWSLLPSHSHLSDTCESTQECFNISAFLFRDVSKAFQYRQHFKNLMMFLKNKFLRHSSHTQVTLCFVVMSPYMSSVFYFTVGRSKAKFEGKALMLKLLFSRPTPTKTVLILMKFLMDEFTFFLPLNIEWGKLFCACERWGKKANKGMYLIIIQHSSNWWNNHWMCLFRSSQFSSGKGSKEKGSMKEGGLITDCTRTDPLRPGKLKNTSGPFRCGIWRRTFKSLAECRGWNEKKKKKEEN